MNPIRTANRMTATSLLAAALATTASAGNVDVSTIPDRDTVQLTVYNAEDLTLVRETRHLTFSKGANPLQFSWSGTLIDPSSVDLRFKTHGEKLDVLDTTFPHDKPQMLYWNVQSELDGDAVVEITYFTSGITWAADYSCVVDPNETHMSFDGYVRITNNSGEDYADAQVRLVVGQINIVERIAELARRGILSRSDANAFNDHRSLRKLNARAAGAVADMLVADMDAAAMAPKSIIKEGLSEYFIYTIDGTETIENTWSKRMRLFEGALVPFEVKYRYRPAEYGEQLVRLFILRNDEKSSLGTTPLPDGVVRLFRDNGRDGLSFLVAHHAQYVPIGQEIELNLGRDPEVVHERIRHRSWRDAFWFRSTNGRKFFSPQHGQQVRHNNPVAGWDDHELWTEKIRNYRDKPIDVEIRRTFHGHVEFDSMLEPALHDFRTPQITTRVPARDAVDLDYVITTHQGISRKQDKVTLTTRISATPDGHRRAGNVRTANARR